MNKNIRSTISRIQKIVLLFSTLLIAQKSFSQKSKVQEGKIHHYLNFYSTHISSRNVDVWLPANYTSKKKYAVLYMHDGQMLFDSSITWNHQSWQADIAISNLLKDKKIRNTIIVAIWNIPATRYADYFPQKTIKHIPDTTLHRIQTEQFKAPPQADNYLRFIVKELKPFIDKTYSTHKDVNNTFIMGSSMGGLISLYALCEYPKVFGGAGCLSIHSPMAKADLIGENTDKEVSVHFRNYLMKHLPKANTKKIYIDYGDKTLDSFYQPYQLAMDKVLKKKGYKAPFWVTRFFPGEGHVETAWAKRLTIPMEFLLKKN